MLSSTTGADGGDGGLGGSETSLSSTGLSPGAGVGDKDTKLDLVDGLATGRPPPPKKLLSDV